MVSPNGEASVVPRGGLRYGPHSVAPKPQENFSRPQSFIPPIGAAMMAANSTHHHGAGEFPQHKRLERNPRGATRRQYRRH